MADTSSILREIAEERIRQDAKWGEQNHPIRPDGWDEPLILMAQNARENCEISFSENKGTWYDILYEEFTEVFAESDPDKQRAELIQVAAVAVAMIECIDRRKEKK
jgi:hypothetical protein